MTYREAVDYLNSFTNYEKKDTYDYAQSFHLERMRRLVSLLGDPQASVKCIHVAGSKGKGSTAAIIQSILTKAGYKTGLYTSPHLVSFRERIRIGDTLISEKDLSVLLAQVKAAADTMADDAPSFFEICTALAFLYFKKMKADLAVYEVGLGGRLDATNIIEPLVSVITPVSLEHTHILGDTLEKIAAEKAGIIKAGSIVVSAPQDERALSAIGRSAEKLDAKLVVVGQDIGFEEIRADDTQEVFSVTGLFDSYPDLHMRLLGYHQIVNAATAIGAVEALRFSGITVGADAVRRGVGSASWPGRLELIKGSPRVLLDGAQNQASAKALSLAVRRSFSYRRLILVLGVSKDKDIKGILKELIPLADAVVLTKARIVERALEPEKIRPQITPADKDVVMTQSVGDALKTACAKAAPQDLVLVAGSLFVVGEARKILKKEKLDE